MIWDLRRLAACHAIALTANAVKDKSGCKGRWHGCHIYQFLRRCMIDSIDRVLDMPELLECIEFH